jgi:MFS family permease
MSDPSGRSSLWRHRDFMKLWTGQTISLLGSQITLLALPLAAILLFKASAFQVGLLGTVEFLPFVLFGLPVGVWVDRLRRRPILILADAARFAIIGSVPLAYALGALHMTQLYVVAFLSGVFTVFFDVAYGSYLPSLVERGHLVEGNSKLEISRSGAQLAGPGLAGLLVQAFSAPVALLADSLSYVASVFSLLLIRLPEPPSEPPAGGRAGMRGEIGEGLRYVLRNRVLRPILACTATLNFFGMMTQAVLLLYAVRELHLSPGVIGAILTVGNVGFLVGAFLAARIAGRLGVGPTLIGAALFIGGSAALVPLATRSTAVPLLVAFTLLASFGGVIYNINGRSVAQTIAPERLLGRTIATNRFIVWGTIPAGSLLGGILGSQVGLRTTLWIAAAGGFVAFLPPLLSPIRRMRLMPSPDPDPEVPIPSTTPTSNS